MSRGKIILVFAVSIILLISSNNILANDYYYLTDNNIQEVNLNDTLVLIRADTIGGVSSSQFAVVRPYLKDEFQFDYISDDFTMFGIEDGWTLDEVIDSLQADQYTLLINPIINASNDRLMYVTNKLVVQFNPGTFQSTIDSILTEFGLSVYKILDSGDSACYFLSYSGKTDQTIIEIANELYETGLCYYSYPNFITTPLASSVPNDSLFSYQWQLHNTGQYGLIDADIDMPEAWDMWPMEHEIVVALIDYGFEMDHADLKPNWAFRPYDPCGNILEENLPDYDPGYYCTDVYNERCMHGTSVLGMLAPVTGNSIGLAGIDSQIKITPIKACDNYSMVSSEKYAEAFQWTRMGGPHNADVICCSWNWDQIKEDPRMKQDIQWSYESGVPVIFRLVILVL